MRSLKPIPRFGAWRITSRSLEKHLKGRYLRFQVSELDHNTPRFKLVVETDEPLASAKKAFMEINRELGHFHFDEIVINTPTMNL